MYTFADECRSPMRNAEETAGHDVLAPTSTYILAMVPAKPLYSPGPCCYLRLWVHEMVVLL